MRCERIVLFLLLALLAPAVRAQDLKEDLWAAARKGDTEAVKALLAKGVDVNAKTAYGATALSYAADKGHVEVVKVLLEKGAEVNVRDTFYGATPINWAVSKGHTEVVLLLLAKGANGSPVLAEAARAGRTAIVKAILEKGNLSPQVLTAALGQATRNNRAEVAELLKQAGAIPPPKPDFQVDAETLKSYAGVYKNQERDITLTLALKDGKLGGTFGSQPPFTLGAFDKVTFAPLEFDGVTITVNLEGDKVTGLTFKQGQMTLPFKKEEAGKVQ